MDIPWWEKLLTARVQDGKLRLGQLSGGKLDDITVVVARVAEAPVEPPPVEAAPPSSENEEPAEVS
jgi:protein phosphatase PTC7